MCKKFFFSVWEYMDKIDEKKSVWISMVVIVSVNVLFWFFSMFYSNFNIRIEKIISLLNGILFLC